MKLRLAVLVGAWVMLGASAAGAATLRYVVLVDGGKQAGEMVVDARDNGRTKVHFVFKDNGRGPELDEEYTLRPDGTYASYRVRGTTTFGAKVDERFERRGDQASWKSTSESGQKQIVFGRQVLLCPLLGHLLFFAFGLHPRVGITHVPPRLGSIIPRHTSVRLQFTHFFPQAAHLFPVQRL